MRLAALSDADLLAQMCTDVYLDLTEGDDPLTADDIAQVRAVVERAHVQLQIVRTTLDNALGDAMDGPTLVVEGVGQITRHRHKVRTKWDKDALLRTVLDSRLVDAKTGEVVWETPLDKVLQVWNLPAPRVTALRTRGIQADEFCETEDKGGWKIEQSNDALDVTALKERAASLPSSTQAPAAPGAASALPASGAAPIDNEGNEAA